MHNRNKRHPRKQPFPFPFNIVIYWFTLQSFGFQNTNSSGGIFWRINQGRDRPCQNSGLLAIAPIALCRLWRLLPSLKLRPTHLERSSLLQRQLHITCTTYNISTDAARLRISSFLPCRPWEFCQLTLYQLCYRVIVCNRVHRAVRISRVRGSLN